jgi:hypothetical protein
MKQQFIKINKAALHFFRQWCSTKVDQFNEHIGGENNWGFCQKSCLILENTNHSSGLWKPSGIRKECGTKLNIRKKRALGGASAEPGDYPYNALIGIEIIDAIDIIDDSKIDGVYYTAAGSVINKWYILTAAQVLVNSQGPIT